MIAFRVYGTAAPQGSKRHVGGGRMVESSKKLGPWRERVHEAAVKAMAGGEPFAVPLYLSVRVTLMRPNWHFRTGKYAGQIKDTAPAWVMTTPDLSKLVRAIEDGMAGVVYRNDSLIVQTFAEKVYGPTPCVDILVRSVEEPIDQRLVNASGGDIHHAAAVERMLRGGVH